MSAAYLSEPMSIQASPLPVLDPPVPVLQTCPCWNGIPSKRRLRPEDFQQDDLISQETDPSQHHDPTYAPTLDANFSMDHMPFRSKRSKRAPRNRRSARDKTQPKIPHNLVDLTGEREWQSRRPHHPRSKLPRRSNCLQKHYNYLTLVCSDGVVHESALLCMNADKIPKAFNLAFVPTRSMDLTGVELAVNSKDHPKRFGDSNVIRQQLAPPCFCFVTHLSSDYAKSDQRVITIVATMLSKTSSQHQWFMPTMIRGPILLGPQQDALQGTRMTQANMDVVVSKHMRCKVDKVTEIFSTDVDRWTLVLDGRGRTPTEAYVLRLFQVSNGD
ncbi:hypothetical protein AHAS_Ahas19G0299700 [Arachis hypogaea]